MAAALKDYGLVAAIVFALAMFTAGLQSCGAPSGDARDDSVYEAR